MSTASVLVLSLLAHVSWCHPHPHFTVYDENPFLPSAAPDPFNRPTMDDGALLMNRGAGLQSMTDDADIVYDAEPGEEEEAASEGAVIGASTLVCPLPQKSQGSLARGRMRECHSADGCKKCVCACHWNLQLVVSMCAREEHRRDDANCQDDDREQTTRSRKRLSSNRMRFGARRRQVSSSSSSGFCKHDNPDLLLREGEVRHGCSLGLAGDGRRPADDACCQCVCRDGKIIQSCSPSCDLMKRCGNCFGYSHLFATSPYCKNVRHAIEQEIRACDINRCKCRSPPPSSTALRDCVVESDMCCRLAGAREKEDKVEQMAINVLKAGGVMKKKGEESDENDESDDESSETTTMRTTTTAATTTATTTGTTTATTTSTVRTTTTTMKSTTTTEEEEEEEEEEVQDDDDEMEDSNDSDDTESRNRRGRSRRRQREHFKDKFFNYNDYAKEDEDDERRQ